MFGHQGTDAALSLPPAGQSKAAEHKDFKLPEQKSSLYCVAPWVKACAKLAVGHVKCRTWRATVSYIRPLAGTMTLSCVSQVKMQTTFIVAHGPQHNVP